MQSQDNDSLIEDAGILSDMRETAGWKLLNDRIKNFDDNEYLIKECSMMDKNKEGLNKERIAYITGRIEGFRLFHDTVNSIIEQAKMVNKMKKVKQDIKSKF